MGEVSDIWRIAAKLDEISRELRTEIENGGDFNLCSKLAEEVYVLTVALDAFFRATKGTLPKRALEIVKPHGRPEAA